MPITRHVYGRKLDDFKEGDIYRHPWEVTVDDGLLGVVAASFMESSPVYFSDHFAQALGFTSRVVHPLVLLNLGLSFSVLDVSEQAIAHLAYIDVRYPNPCYVGDSVTAASEVVGTKMSGSGDKGTVHVITTLWNQNNVPVCIFERKALIRAGAVEGSPRKPVSITVPTSGEHYPKMIEDLDFANERGVAIMGDLPIFVAHHGADCWARPDLYALDADFQPTVVAGAPPDTLGPDGQRWGNPMYRWDRMAAEGWAWWTARLRRMLRHADAVRIDHFRGFAAYWEIPADAPDARRGRWRPGPGRALFDAASAALGPLPIVAEDLGFITPDVHALREALGYPGMKVLQYAFGGDATHEYLPHNFEPRTAVYTGTHDTDTIVGWWRAASEPERRFAATYLACGDADLHWAAIRAAYESVAALAMVPMQDLLGLGSEHRMNTPGTLGPPNWGWRFDWDMVGPEPARVLALMAAASGRGPFDPIGPPRPPQPPASY